MIPATADQQVEPSIRGKGDARYFVSGFLVGEKSWFPTGAIRSECPYKNGVPHGVTLHWHENGQLEARVTFREGERHGCYERFSKDGKMVDGYPKYSLDGKEVSKTRFQRAVRQKKLGA